MKKTFIQGQQIKLTQNRLCKRYNAIVGGFWKGTEGKNYVMAYGYDIDGDIAAFEKLEWIKTNLENK